MHASINQVLEFCRIWFAIALGYTFIGSYACAADREQAQSSAKLHWESISSLRFRCELYPVINGERLGRIASYDVRYLAPDRWIVDARRETQRGMPLIQRFLQQDGKLKRFHYDQGKDTPKHEMIKALVGNPSNYQGEIFPITQLLMPGGKSAWEHFQDESKYEHSKGEKPILTTTFKMNSMILEFSPDNDWMASKVTMGEGGYYTLTASRFGEDNGRSFPVEGFEERTIDGKTQRIEFVVTDLQVNRPIDSGAFREPKMGEGTVVEDAIKDRSYKIELKTVGDLDKASTRPDQHQGIIADEAAGWGLVNKSLIALSILFMIVALALYAKRS